ncbi:MAG: hydroxymethylglutaryl-CoA lyase, partial [Xylophilus sp.]|nr:hydroxymethylglutaryl-CoA lyase [Xylophilus sp.]
MNTSIWNGAGRRIYMQEVGTRDGLQMEQAFVPTEDKIALVNALSAAGLAKIEVTSFTSPTAIPALRDAEIVMREIERRPGVVYTALVPNLRGAERAIESKTDELNLVMSVSETHNLANLRMTREQSFASLAQVVGMAQAANVEV